MTWTLIGNLKGLKGDVGDWAKGTLTANDHLDDLTEPGLYTFLNATIAEAIGSPISPYGAVEVIDVGNSTIQRIRGTDEDPRVLERGTTAGGASWGAFRRTDNTTKTALYQVSLPGNSNLNEVAPARHVRAPFKIAAPADGFRLYFRNYNDQTSKNYAGDLTFSGVYFGKRAKDSAGLYTNDFAETPVNLGIPTRTTLADGSYRWVTGTKYLRVEAHTEYLISYGYTTPAGQVTHVGNGGAYVGVVPGAASYTDASTMTWSDTMPLDVYMTLLVPEDTPVYGYLGSSTAVGVNTDHPVWDSFGWRHAYATGAIPTLLAHSGSAMASWDSASEWKWEKARAYDRLDRLYFNAGSNDVNSTATPADLQSRNNAVAKVVRSQVADQLFYVNIAPRAGEAADIRAKREAYNDWLATLPNGAMATYDVASVVTGPDGALDPAYNSGDGVHISTLGQAKTAEVLIRGNGKDGRATATAVADLPAAAAANRGRIVYVVAENEPYYSNGTSWQPVSTGAQGSPGPPGSGVPAGGSALQVIRKNSTGTTTEWATPDKAMVGLGNVDNTTDADKPVSVAQAAALSGKADAADLAAKENAVALGTAVQVYRGDKTWVAADKALVGLSKVDNTADADKPLSAAATTALGAKLDKSEAASTYATNASVTTEIQARVDPAVANAIANDPTVASSAANMAQSTAGLVPVWKADTAYTAGQRVIAPNGDVVSVKVPFTSGTTYSAANWNVSTQDARIGTLETNQLPDRGNATVALYTTADNIIVKGTYALRISTDASGLGFPSGNAGKVDVYDNNGQIIQVQTALESGWQLYFRRRNAGVWSAWESPFKTLASSITTTNANVTTVTNKVSALEATKKALVSLSRSAGTEYTNAGPVSITQRQPFRTGGQCTSFRVCFRNYDERSNTAYAGQVTVNGVWMGEAQLGADGKPNGQFKGTPVQVSGALTGTSDGSVFSTALISSTTFAIDPNKTYIVSYGLDGAGTVLHRTQGQSWFTSSPLNADDPEITITLTASKFSILETWVEVNTRSPRVAWVGDSHAAGGAADLAVFEAPVNVYCFSNGAVPVNSGWGGARIAELSVGTDARWLKHTQAAAGADAWVLGIGQNSIYNDGLDLATLQSQLATVVGIGRNIFGPNMYLATIMPRNIAGQEAQNSVRLAYNDWLRSLPHGALNCYDIAEEVTTPADALDSRYIVADNIHMKTAGNAKQTHAIVHTLGAHAVV